MKGAGMRLVVGIVAAAVVAAVVAGASATTYLVRPDGTGDFPTIQAAIDAAADDDTIQLGSGTFVGSGNHTVSYLGKEIVVCSQSGDPTQCIIDCQGSPGNDRAGFLIEGDDEIYSATLRGVTITGAHVGWMSGAIYCGQGQLRIEDCVLVGNSGSALLTLHACPAVLVRCWFVDNSGGAISCWQSSVQFESCQFLRNSGGACEIDVGGLRFTNCVFSSAPGTSGYAVAAHFFAQVHLTGCTITGIEGSDIIRLDDVDDAITLNNTIIAYNHATTTFRCGGSITLRRSDVYGNEGGDWVGCVADQLGLNGNICLDPQFCSENSTDDENWSIQNDSPCAPEQSGCGLIGAWDVGCGTVDAEERTWGGVKLLFAE
jgi:hypothetical protein